MKRLSITLLVVGFVLVSTPHMFCPIACGYGPAVTARQGCPHCSPKEPAPSPTPSKECESPCCHTLDAVIAAASPPPGPSHMLCGPVIDEMPAILSLHADSSDHVVQFVDHTPLLQRSGCALIVFLGHLLL
jgi:hypothetical protein